MSRYRREHEKIVGAAQARALKAEAENKALKQSLENDKRYLQDKDMMLAASAMAMQKVVDLLRIMRNSDTLRWVPVLDNEREAMHEIDRIVEAQKSKTQP